MDVAVQSPALDAEFFNEILESNKDAVRATVRDALLEGVKRQFQWELPDAVKKAVAEFVTDEIIPEIKAELEANKDTFVQAATDMVRGAPAEIGKAMQAHLAKNLTDSWKLRQVVEACFK
jgi:transcription termination factor NusB